MCVRARACMRVCACARVRVRVRARARVCGAYTQRISKRAHATNLLPSHLPARSRCPAHIWGRTDDTWQRAAAKWLVGEMLLLSKTRSEKERDEELYKSEVLVSIEINGCERVPKLHPPHSPGFSATLFAFSDK